MLLCPLCSQHLLVSVWHTTTTSSTSQYTYVCQCFAPNAWSTCPLLQSKIDVLYGTTVYPRCQHEPRVGTDIDVTLLSLCLKFDATSKLQMLGSSFDVAVSIHLAARNASFWQLQFVVSCHTARIFQKSCMSQAMTCSQQTRKAKITDSLMHCR